MFDLDGTLILSNRQLGEYKVLPGAVELLETLDAQGIPYLAMTNGSAYAAKVQAPKLRAVGLPIRDDRLFTPNSVAAKVIKDRSFTNVLVLGTEGVVDALKGHGLACCLASEKSSALADAVYVAWHPDCTMEDIHVACGRVMEGAAFLTASDVPFFATQAGPAFGYSSAICGAIARVTGQEPEVTGKPSLHAMEFVAAELGVPASDVWVIGDDPRVETEMARLGGAVGVGVCSGTTAHDEWAAQPAERRPHLVIENVGELLAEGLLPV